jgi:hypothetical protein
MEARSQLRHRPTLRKDSFYSGRPQRIRQRVRELIAYLPVSKGNRVSEHSARAGEVFLNSDDGGITRLNRGVQRCLVYPKGNRYLADWYDRKGRRRRKSFTTPEAAQASEDVQNATARPKAQRGGGLQSQKLSHPSTAQNRNSTPRKSQQSSSKSTALSGRAISARRTSASSTRGSRCPPRIHRAGRGTAAALRRAIRDFSVTKLTFTPGLQAFVPLRRKDAVASRRVGVSSGR